MTQTIAAALKKGAEELGSVADSDPKREARLLLTHVLGRSTSYLLSSPYQRLTAEEAARYQTALSARQDHKPISQITGKRAFWDHEFLVTPDVLDPRPDTELLVELALERPGVNSVLDLGTGSGCILCSVLYARPGVTGLGVDRSQAALDVARQNAEALGLSGRVVFKQSSWFEQVEGQFDLILSNPPYVTAAEYATLDPGVRKWEPEFALTDGDDGLHAYRDIAAGLDRFLAPGGLALFEHGIGQAQAIQSIFKSAGFSRTQSFRDLNNKNRVVSVER